jgi:hypothetical protein
MGSPAWRLRCAYCLESGEEVLERYFCNAYDWTNVRVLGKRGVLAREEFPTHIPNYETGGPLRYNSQQLRCPSLRDARILVFSNNGKDLRYGLSLSFASPPFQCIYDAFQAKRYPEQAVVYLS